jgi:hypothetical protein
MKSINKQLSKVNGLVYKATGVEVVSMNAWCEVSVNIESEVGNIIEGMANIIDNNTNEILFQKHIL